MSPKGKANRFLGNFSILLKSLSISNRSYILTTLSYTVFLLIVSDTYLPLFCLGALVSSIFSYLKCLLLGF